MVAVSDHDWDELHCAVQDTTRNGNSAKTVLSEKQTRHVEKMWGQSHLQLLDHPRRSHQYIFRPAGLVQS